MIISDINSLTPQFKKKVEAFLKDAKFIWLNIKIYEAKRTIQRQIQLYNQWRITKWKIVTNTLKSEHLKWTAVDIVFVDKKWNISWNWNYEALISIAKKYWIDNLKPFETCHFQDNGTLIFNLNNIMSPDYTLIMNDVLKETWFTPIFTSHEWDNNLTEREVKELIEIALARFFARLSK